MLETKEQKKYFILSLAAAAVLLGVVIFQRVDFKFSDKTDYAAKEKQAKAIALAYGEYLKNIKTDPAASAQLLKSIITEEDIRKQVEEELQTSRKITAPAVDEKTLNISSASGQQAVEDYLTQALGPILLLNKNTSGLNQNLFTDSTAAYAIKREYDQAFSKLMGASVPKEALPVQKALVSAYITYGQLINSGSDFISQKNMSPWPDSYAQYVAVNDSALKFNESYNQLVNKYKLADSFIVLPKENASGISLVPKAQALFGLGDFSITIGDVPRIIMDSVKEGLTSSFSQFMSSFLSDLVQKIENNYMIANFLYYSDALVSGQYANDYLNKYVNDNLDKQIIRQFIPQFSCNKQNAALKDIFKAKASQNLGFDPSSLNPNDPNYYQKLSKVGNFMSSPTGQQFYYEDLASEAESQAQIAVDRELSSSGLKSPRDAVAGGIKNSINSIVSSQKAGLEAMLQVGITNASSLVSKFVAQVSQTFFTKFVFSGVTPGPRDANNSSGVLKEQPTCLASAQLAPIVPLSTTQYQNPPAPPTQQDIINEACANLPRGCDEGTPTNQTNP